jgi:hypothetical protein
MPENDLRLPCCRTLLFALWVIGNVAKVQSGETNTDLKLILHLHRSSSRLKSLWRLLLPKLR